MKIHKILILGGLVFSQTQIIAKSTSIGHISTKSLRSDHGPMESPGISTSLIFDSPERSDSRITNYFTGTIKNGRTVNSLGNIESVSHVLANNTIALDDLPEKIQTFIKERNKPNPDFILKLPMLEKRFKDYLSDKSELTFGSASMYTLPNKSKQYEVFVKFYGITDLPMIFDENANLIWVGSFQRLESLVNLDDLSGGPSKIKKEDLSFFTNEFKSANEFKDYSIKEPTSGSEASANTYANVKCYEFQLSKQTDRGSELWVLRYDSNKRLISSHHSGKL